MRYDRCFFWNHEVVNGISKLNNQLYVLFVDSIAVYEYQSKICTKTFRIHELRNGGTIASCHISNCLYVLDKCKGIWKYSLVEINRAVQSTNFITLWLLSPFSTLLSVCEDGMLILVKPLPCLELLNVNGVLQKTIQLPSFMLNVMGAVRTMSGNFVVSFRCGGGKQHGICKVNENGEVLKFFKSLVEWECISCPGHLTVDGYGDIFVIDVVRGRIICLDKRLCFKGVASSQQPDSYLRPVTLSVDYVTKLLVVTYSSMTEVRRVDAVIAYTIDERLSTVLIT